MAYNDGRQGYDPMQGHPSRGRPLSYYPGDDGLSPEFEQRNAMEDAPSQAIQQPSHGSLQRTGTMGPRPPPPPSTYSASHPQPYQPAAPGAQQPFSHRTYNPQSYVSAAYSPPPPPPPQQSSYSPNRTYSTQGPRPYNPAAYSNTATSSYSTSTYRPPEPASYAYTSTPPLGSYTPTSPVPSNVGSYRSSMGLAYGNSSMSADGYASSENRLSAGSPLNSPVPYSSSPDLTHRNSPSAGLMGSSSQVMSSSRFSPRLPYPTSTQSAEFPEEPTSYPGFSGVSSMGANALGYSGSTRHPQSRPLPGPPIDTSVMSTFFDESVTDDQQAAADALAAEMAQEDLFNQVENAVMAHTWTATTAPAGYEEHQVDSRQQSPASASPREAHPSSYPDFEYDSDAEAAAGVEAMRMAEEQEAEERRRSSQRGVLMTNGTNQNKTPEEQEPASAGVLEDGEGWGYDISSLGGGVDLGITYGNTVTQLVAGGTNGLGRNHQSVSSRSSFPIGIEDFPARSSSNTSMTTVSGYHQPVSARVDEFGTGGLADPAYHRRKLSFDDGDDDVDLYDENQLGLHTGDDELFLSAQPSPSRPLPPPPRDEQPLVPYMQSQFDASTLYGQQGMVPGAAVPRSISLLSHGRPLAQVPQPIRSKTDAEEKRRQTMIRASTYGAEGIYEGPPAQAAASFGLDLPTLPTGKRFKPAALGQRDFDRCTEPWALGSIIRWLKSLADSETELREHTVHEALINLFTAKVANLNIADAESLSMLAIQEMYAANVLVKEEEWLKFGSGHATGVFYQLTGKGCYSQALHDHDSADQRCYSYHCQRTERKLLYGDIADVKILDWPTHWGFTREDMVGFDKNKVALQNAIHEVIQNEEKYLQDLNVIQKVYKESLETAQPPVLAPKVMERFKRDIFDKIDAVRAANGDYLLPQLKYRQKEQGPWIREISDIFRDWLRKAKLAYVDYAQSYPKIESMMLLEEQRNVLFRSFLEAARSNPLSQRLEWKNYFKAPVTKLQRYALLLEGVVKKMPECDERRSILTASNEIKAVTTEADAKFGESNRKNNLAQLAAKIILRPEMKRVDLNLNQIGRELLYEGDLQRTGTSRFTWLETHGMLFDHYLVLAKIVSQRDAPGGAKYERYDVSKMPIPMDLLTLESAEDDPVVKSTVKGIGAVAAARPAPPTETRSSRSASNQSPRPETLQHTSSGGSLLLTKTASSTQIHTPTNLEGRLDKDSEKILYPFRIRHLGKEVYTLYANTPEARKTWADKILEAKTRHAASLHVQNVEPFRLRILADTAFAYDSYGVGQRSVLIKGTPLARAIEEVEQIYANSGRPAPICRVRVNCATTFTQPSGTEVLIVGTDHGVYVCDMGSPRGWSRAILAVRVTQIAVMEDFNLILLISDKALVAYHLDVVCPASGTAPPNESIRKAPQKLSGARDVGFFAVGRLKDRTLVLYKKREGLSSTFKVLEPVQQKATERKTRLHILHRGHTEFFREYDDGFYIPADCSGISIFSSSIAVASAKGFEVLNLEKKTPWSVPDLKQQHVATIAQRLQGQETVAMFKLDSTTSNSNPPPSGAYAGSDSQALSAAGGVGEFLCVYEECAVYVNKHGDISRSVVMEFVGRAREACLVKGFLVLFDSDFVEVRDALSGRLKQIISGRDVRCIDNGRGGGISGPYNSPVNGTTNSRADHSRTVKLALQHPENEKVQLVVEMLLNGEAP